MCQVVKEPREKVIEALTTILQYVTATVMMSIILLLEQIERIKKTIADQLINCSGGEIIGICFKGE